MSNLSIGEMQALVNVIDVCCQRGAFKGEEITSIGMLREKLVATINLHAELETEQPNNNLVLKPNKKK